MGKEPIELLGGIAGLVFALDPIWSTAGGATLIGVVGVSVVIIIVISGK